MYRTLTIVLVLFATLLSHAQTTFNFSYIGPLPPSCNPFDTPSNFIEGWKPSHGSPQAGDVYGQNVFNKGRLVAKWQAGDSKEKGEGVYIAYNFQANHKYEVIILSAHDQGNIVGLDVFAANGMTEKSNSSCGEEEIPSVSDKKEIYATNMVYDGPTGNFKDEIVDFYPGAKNYSYLWVLARQYTYQASGSVFIDQIIIVDHGLVATSPPTSTECPSKLLTDKNSLRLAPVNYGANRFGQWVASSGDYFVSGAPGERSVYVYKNENCSVRLKAVLKGDDFTGSRFGWCVDINNDEIIVGDPGSESNGGRVYFFKRNGETWARVNKFTSIYDYGFAVAIDDSYALVGSPKGANSFGLAIFYEKTSDGTWVYHGEFAGSESGSGFGNAVDIRNNTGIVGAPLKSNSIYLFERIWVGTGIWTSKAGFRSGTADEELNDKFGYHVVLSDDGLSAYASGAYLRRYNDDDGASVLSFELNNGTWIYVGRSPLNTTSSYDFQTFAINGNRLVFARPFGLGIFEKQDKKWVQVSGVRMPDTYWEWKYRYGSAITSSNNFIVVGAPEPLCSYPGSAYVYDMFAALHSNTYHTCNQSYSGTLNDVNARTVTLGCDGGSMTYLPGSKANYYGNVVKMTPGFNAKAGSIFRATAMGCSFGTIAENARVANNEGQSEETSFSDTLSLIVEKDEIVTLENTEFSVFPNPTDDGNITLLSSSGVIDSFTIYTLQGIPVKTFQSNRVAKNMIDVKLPNDIHGVYMVKANVDKKSVIKKVYVK